jgi:hypothetical protein
LNDAEKNYPVHEKELLAIVHAVRSWRHHIQGAQQFLTVLTDHVPLRYFLKQPKLSQRQVRWTDLFASLDIKYKPGKENTVPDAFSRRPDYKMILCGLFNSSPLPDTDFLRNLRTALTADPVTKNLLCPATANNSNYRSINGLLYLLGEQRYRLYIPEDKQFKAMLLHDFHPAPSAAHPGMHRTFQDLKTNFYWPRMIEDVKSYVGSCRHCHLVKPAALPTAPLITFPLPKKPFEEIALNFVGPLLMTPRHHDFLLKISCRLTKFAIAIPCSQKIDKQQLAETLFNEVFCSYGIPLVIVSDRDPRLDNAFFSQLLPCRAPPSA